MVNEICEVEDCERTDVIARHFCNMHYARWKRHGDPHFVTPPGEAVKRAVKAHQEAAANRREEIAPGNICVREDCDKPVYRVKTGLCKMHEARLYKGFNLDLPPLPQYQSKIEGLDTHRICTTCEKVKPIGDFYTNRTQCKICVSLVNGIRQHLNRHRDPELTRQLMDGWGGRLLDRGEWAVDRWIERNGR